MILLLLGISLLSSSFAQYSINSIQPDVKFTEGNDRFDLTDMIQDTNRMFSQNQLDPEEDDYRRNLNSNEEDLHIVDDLALVRRQNNEGLFSARRSDDFAYHDRMESNEAGTRMDFEENLKHFMTKDHFKKRHSRRMADYDLLYGRDGSFRRSDIPQRDQEVLMHYAMPVVMTIDGFIKVPTKQ